MTPLPCHTPTDLNTENRSPGMPAHERLVEVMIPSLQMKVLHKLYNIGTDHNPVFFCVCQYLELITLSNTMFMKS